MSPKKHPHRKPKRVAYGTLTCLVVALLGLAAHRTLDIRVIPPLLSKATEEGGPPEDDADGEKEEKEEDKDKKKKEKEKDEPSDHGETLAENFEVPATEPAIDDTADDPDAAPAAEEQDQESLPVVNDPPALELEEAAGTPQQNEAPDSISQEQPIVVPPAPEEISDEPQTTDSGQASTPSDTGSGEPEPAPPVADTEMPTEAGPTGESTSDNPLQTQSETSSENSPTADAPSATEPLATTDTSDGSVSSAEQSPSQAESIGEPVALAEPTPESSSEAPIPEPDAPAQIPDPESTTPSEPEAVGEGGGGGGWSGPANTQAEYIARLLWLASIKDYLPPRRPEIRPDFAPRLAEGDLREPPSFARPTRRTIRRLFSR